MQRYAKPAENAAAGVNLAAHLLNAVDIPLGATRRNYNTFKDSDYTIWITIKDLKNKIVYFRTYENLMLRAIDNRERRTREKPLPDKNRAVHGTRGRVAVRSQLRWQYVPCW